MQKGGELPLGAPFEDAIVRLIGEEDVSFRIGRGTLGELEPARELFELGARGENAFVLRPRQQIVEIGDPERGQGHHLGPLHQIGLAHQLERIGLGMVREAVAGDLLAEDAAGNARLVEGVMIAARDAASDELLDAQLLEAGQVLLQDRQEFSPAMPAEAGHASRAGVVHERRRHAR